jgi:hypothetical protein
MEAVAHGAAAVAGDWWDETPPNRQRALPIPIETRTLPLAEFPAGRRVHLLRPTRLQTFCGRMKFGPKSARMSAWRLDAVSCLRCRASWLSRRRKAAER